MSEIAHCARKFGNRLRARFRRHCEEIDERLTTKDAKSRWSEMQKDLGKPNKRWQSDIHPVDGIAAQLILENWFLRLEQSPNT